ncbi:MAG: purine-nucleoside phosphorylase [Planctomycetes bacterium]|nr:purine-nucleoside phosphorylase [Planctomycetota bacterium]
MNSGDHNIEGEVQRLRSAAYRLEVAGLKPARLGIVLGSGLKDFAEHLEDPIVISFNDIPEFPRTRVRGHGGELVQGRVGETLVHCLTGRVHLYEGHHVWEVVRAVRTLALFGTSNFLLTNAAGGIRKDLAPGTLMLLTDHINMTGTNVLLGDHHECLGPRFPPMSRVYSETARKILQSASQKPLAEGVYAQMMGPSYETPAEIRMLSLVGADAVGMSTVPEAIALHAMGCRVAAMSLVTNNAAGVTEDVPNHDEVVSEGAKAAKRMSRLLLSAIPALGRLGRRKANC